MAGHQLRDALQEAWSAPIAMVVTPTRPLLAAAALQQGRSLKNGSPEIRTQDQSVKSQLANRKIPVRDWDWLPLCQAWFTASSIRSWGRAQNSARGVAAGLLPGLEEVLAAGSSSRPAALAQSH